MEKTLVDHLYDLFRDEKYNGDVFIENESVHHMVWEGHPIKVNGDDFSYDELYDLLAQTGDLYTTCDGMKFRKVGNKFLAIGKSSTIERVEITLDDDVPEYMDGIIRIGSVKSYRETGELFIDHQDLVDNVEFHSEKSLISYVATELGIEKDIVEIIE